MLAHRADHLLLANRIFGGVGEKGDIGAALARLLDADRELDIEGVRQVVDDHADDAGFGASQGRRAAMVDVAELVHRVARRVRVSLRHERASAENQGDGRFRDACAAGDVDDASRGPREPQSPCASRRSYFASSWYVPNNVSDPIFYSEPTNACILAARIWNVLITVAALSRPVNPNSGPDLSASIPAKYPRRPDRHRDAAPRDREAGEGDGRGARLLNSPPPKRSAGARQRRRRTAGGGRNEAARPGRPHRDPERLRRHVGMLRFRKQTLTQPTARGRATTTEQWPRRSARAAR